MQTPTDNQLHELARKRVDFRVHLVVYCVTNAALWIIWFVTGRGYVWPVWPMAAWGIGVVFHYIFDYRSSGFLSEEDEYKKLKKEIEEHKRIPQ
jgi:2TM domain